MAYKRTIDDRTLPLSSASSSTSRPVVAAPTQSAVGAARESHRAKIAKVVHSHTPLDPCDAAFEVKEIYKLLLNATSPAYEHQRACTAHRQMCDIALGGSIIAEQAEERAHLVGSTIAATLQRLKQLGNLLDKTDELGPEQ